jgi:hypothetical protein
VSLSKAVLVFSITLRAGTSSGETIQIATEADSLVRIAITRPFATQGGYCPLRVLIGNRGDRDGEWAFDFTAYGGSGSTHRSQRVLAVAAGEERAFDIVVPLATPPGETGPLHVRASGRGIESSWDQPILQYGYAAEFQYWLAVSQQLHGDTGLDPANAFDPALLPSDWRGYLSLSVLALGDDELLKASPEQRTALLEWAARGGRLVRIGKDSLSVESYGLGTVVRAPRPADASEWAELFRFPNRQQRLTYDSWVRQTFAAIASQSGLLLTFLVGYAVLVGPVNLFVFCSKGRRARLFWTMPTLALAASAFLTVLILLQDGIGGSGKRVAFVRLVPELTREVVVQEQLSRTGALLNRNFEVDEPVALFDAWTGASPSRGEYVSSAGSFGGSWFRSRAIQVQKLEAVRPTRARIDWLGDWRIHSSVDAPIEEIFFRDVDGRVLRASGLTPGGEVRFAAASETEYEKFRDSLMPASGPSVSVQLFAAYESPGVFLALARPGGAKVPIETLGGIEWEDTVIYSGRIGGRE